MKNNLLRNLLIAGLLTIATFSFEVAYGAGADAETEATAAGRTEGEVVGNLINIPLPNTPSDVQNGVSKVLNMRGLTQYELSGVTVTYFQSPNGAHYVSAKWTAENGDVKTHHHILTIKKRVVQTQIHMRAYDINASIKTPGKTLAPSTKTASNFGSRRFSRGASSANAFEKRLTPAATGTGANVGTARSAEASMIGRVVGSANTLLAQ